MPGRSLIRLPRRLLFSALGVSLAFTVGCDAEPRSGDAEEASGIGDGGLRIAVSLPPLAWAAAALAPEGSDVTLLLDPGTSPHGATLSASRARALAEADLILLVGWNFEPAMERILLADRRPRQVLRLSEVVAGWGMTPPALHLPEGASRDPGSQNQDRDQDRDQDHDQDHAHGHGPEDPHAWLDPLAMEAWVEALGERLGAPRETIDSLRAITSEVDARYREGLGLLTQRALVSHHDGLGWLARRYDLEVLAVLSPEGLVETRPSDVRRVTEAIQGRGLGALFIEPQFGDRAALRIRDLTDVELVTLDPVGTADWPATMRANLEQLQRGLSAPPPGASPLAASPRAAPLPAADRKGP